MPNIYVEGPPIDLDKKREMAQQITKTASKAYGLDERAIIVVIRENPSENVCVGGRMVCDDRAIQTDD